jgi:hypothetical protein
VSNRRALLLLYVVNAAIVVALSGGGVDLLVKQETGTAAKAQVTDCVGYDGRYTHVECSGTWIVGGSLLGNGHVVVGTINGAERGDIGKTINVLLSGGEAYTKSLTTSIVLIAVGLAWAALFGVVMFLIRRASRPA